MKNDFALAINQLSAERGVNREIILSKVEHALSAAFQKDILADDRYVSVKLSLETGMLQIYPLRYVVEHITNHNTEISLKEALFIDPNAQIGSVIIGDESIQYDSTRISARLAKQILLQGLHDAEQEKIFHQYKSMQGKVVTGVIELIDQRKVIHMKINALHNKDDNASLILFPENQISTEVYKRGQNLKVLLLDIQYNQFGRVKMIASRKHRVFVEKLMQQSVPEIENGAVDIVKTARIPGIKSKIVVRSNDSKIDPVGSCIGMRGRRIQNIIADLHGERIDLIKWTDDEKILLKNLLSPADIQNVEFDFENNTAYIIVHENQMTLAIGKNGINARLAAQISGYKLAIRTIAQWELIAPSLAKQSYRKKNAETIVENAELNVAVESIDEIINTDQEYSDDENNELAQINTPTMSINELATLTVDDILNIDVAVYNDDEEEEDILEQEETNQEEYFNSSELLQNLLPLPKANKQIRFAEDIVKDIALNSNRFGKSSSRSRRTRRSRY